MGCEVMYDIMLKDVSDWVGSSIYNYPTRKTVNDSLRALRSHLGDPDTKRNFIYLCEERQRHEKPEDKVGYK